MADIFTTDPDTGEIVYEPINKEDVTNESGDLFNASGTEGPVLSGEEETEETQEPVIDSPDIVGTPVLLSEEVTQALLAQTPATGSLNSSTINYFDRLVSGLPNDYGYVAFRNDSQDAYSGTIIYGKDYDYNNGTVVFGKGAVEVDVSRVSTSGSNNTIRYESMDASDSYVQLRQSGTILYYTNAVEGYPILGGTARPVGMDSLLTVGLIVAMATAIITKLLSRR